MARRVSKKKVAFPGVVYGMATPWGHGFYHSVEDALLDRGEDKEVELGVYEHINTVKATKKVTIDVVEK